MNYRIIFLLLFLIATSCRKSSSIKDFKPSKFDWSIHQKIYILSKKTLFVLKDNLFSNKELLYNFEESSPLINDNVFVSPDSDKILICDNTKIVLINTSQGDKTEELNLEWDLPKMGPFILSNKSVQWSPDSRNVGILTSNPNDDEDYLLNIYDVELEDFVLQKKVPYMMSFYFSKSSKSIFYKSFSKDEELYVKEVSIESGKIINSYNEYPDDKIFVNAFPKDLFNHTPDLRKKVVDSWKYAPEKDLLSGNYLLSGDTLKLLLEGNQSEENFKEFKESNHIAQHSYFLPGGRYYVYYTNNKQYKGNLLLDTKTKKYQKLGENLKFYYALNSNHYGQTKNGKLKYLDSYNRNSSERIESDLVVVYD